MPVIHNLIVYLKLQQFVTGDSSALKLLLIAFLTIISIFE